MKADKRTLIKAPTRKKSRNARVDCKIENCEYLEEIKRRFWEFEAVSSIAEDISSRGFYLSENSVHRWAERSGEFAARAKDTDHILDMVIKRGLAKHIPMDGKTGIAALKLRMQKHKEIESNTNINIQIIKSPEQINERINQANRLLPMSN